MPRDVDFAQHGLGGERAVEDQFLGIGAGEPVPVAGEAQGGLMAIALAHRGVGVAEGARLGVADDEGPAGPSAGGCAWRCSASGARRRRRGRGWCGSRGRRTRLGGRPWAIGGGEPAAGERGQFARVDAAAVLAEGGALGEGVEAGEEGEAGVEDMLHGVGVAGDAPELEGEQGAEGAAGRQGVGAGEGALVEQGVEVEAGEQGQEEEEAAKGGAEGAGGGGRAIGGRRRGLARDGRCPRAGRVSAGGAWRSRERAGP